VPTLGSGDFCLIASVPLDTVIAHLRSEGIALEAGPVSRRGALGALLLRETGTLGYRVRRTGRVVLRRREVQVAVEGGTVRVKAADLGGEPVRFEPEYEDCRRIAEKTGRPLREVLDAARHARR
jgi:hypothetical protein